MKTNGFIILGILGSILIAVLAYFWATGMMDSLYAFRSPLHTNPPEAGQPLGNPLTRRLVLVLIDGLRDDTSQNSEVMPYLNTLRTQGAWATVHSRTPSYTAPGHSVLMIGAWPDLSDGPAMNLDYENIPTWTQDNLFTAAQRANLKSAISGFNWYEKFVPQQAVAAHFYTAGEDQQADRQVVEAALPWLNSGDYNFVLVYLLQVDYAGHYEGGPLDSRWSAAASRADGLLKEIANSLDLAQDTIAITSDHGHIDRGGHGGQEPINLVEPFVLAGAGVKPGHYPDIQQVDIAPTLSALLGMNIPATAQGLVQTNMLVLSADQKAQIEAAQMMQKYQLAVKYIEAIQGSSDTQQASGSTSELLQAMESAKNKRLNSERLLRFILAIFLALIPTIALYIKRGKTVTWLFSGALLYLVFFNFRYAILARRTYSLSSVASANDIIAFAGITAAVALVIAWLVISLALGSFKSAPRRASENTLGLIFVTLYLLALPILWSFVLNGALVTWSLPDFASMFLGFLSVLQSMVLAVVGLLLTGLTALIAYFSTRRSKTAASTVR